jgi:DNA-binding NarL/FixJ family response regulator
MTLTPAAHPFRLLLVDDHRMFREWLGTMLAATGRYRVVGESDNTAEALQLARSLQPDAITVDLGLRGPGGLELIKDLRAFDIQTPILVLSMHDDHLYAQRALRAGATGYLNKSEASSTVVLALDQIMRGEVYLGSQATAKILHNLAYGSHSAAGSIESLADRELEVFQLIGKGFNIPKIAEVLHLGETTVGTYRSRIKEKLSLKTSAELYALAARWLQEKGA